MAIFTEIYNMKKGEKFYYSPDEIFTLIDYDIDHNNPDVMKLIIKPLGSRYVKK